VIDEVVVENTVTPAFDYNFTKKINYGEKTSDVKALQTLLKLDGTFQADIDCTGYYGYYTQQAVKAFCSKYKVANILELVYVNGRWCGPKTLKKLNELVASLKVA
jgi:peptidoglycan hydrolase-like protein with peptidoglycan-binding domain